MPFMGVTGLCAVVPTGIAILPLLELVSTMPLLAAITASCLKDLLKVMVKHSKVFQYKSLVVEPLCCTASSH
jgi:hypothetical protein